MGGGGPRTHNCQGRKRRSRNCFPSLIFTHSPYFLQSQDFVMNVLERKPPQTERTEQHKATGCPPNRSVVSVLRGGVCGPALLLPKHRAAFLSEQLSIRGKEGLSPTATTRPDQHSSPNSLSSPLQVPLLPSQLLDCFCPGDGTHGHTHSLSSVRSTPVQRHSHQEPEPLHCPCWTTSPLSPASPENTLAPLTINCSCLSVAGHAWDRTLRALLGPACLAQGQVLEARLRPCRIQSFPVSAAEGCPTARMCHTEAPVHRDVWPQGVKLL